MKKIQAFVCVGLIAAVVVFSGFAPADSHVMSDPELGQND